MRGEHGRVGHWGRPVGVILTWYVLLHKGKSSFLYEVSDYILMAIFPTYGQAGLAESVGVMSPVPQNGKQILYCLQVAFLGRKVEGVVSMLQEKKDCCLLTEFYIIICIRCIFLLKLQ